VVLASTAHVQIVFQLSYTAATVITRYTGAGCAGEKRGEEKQGSLSLSLSLCFCCKGSFLMAFVPLFLLVSMDSKLTFRYEGYDEALVVPSTTSE
jgi:hypothetical protein